MKKCSSALLASAAGLLFCGSVLGGPVTVTGGSLFIGAHDGSSTTFGRLPSQTTNLTDSVTNGASSSQNAYQFTHGATWSNFAIQMNQTHGANSLASATGSAVISFTIAVPMTYEFTGSSTVPLTGESLFQGALSAAVGGNVYNEVDKAISAAGNHVLNNVGTFLFTGTRTGTIGAGDYTVVLNAWMQAVSSPVPGSTVSSAGFFNVRFEDMPPVVPLPTGAAMAMVGLGVVGLRRRRS